MLDVGVLCNSEDITLTLPVTSDFFNGMIYPKGLSKNSTCMTEYIQQEASTIMQLTGAGGGDSSPDWWCLMSRWLSVSGVGQEAESLTPRLTPRHWITTDFHSDPNQSHNLTLQQCARYSYLQYPGQDYIIMAALFRV